MLSLLAATPQLADISSLLRRALLSESEQAEAGVLPPQLQGERPLRPLAAARRRHFEQRPLEHVRIDAERGLLGEHACALDARSLAY